MQARLGEQPPTCALDRPCECGQSWAGGAPALDMGPGPAMSDRSERVKTTLVCFRPLLAVLRRAEIRAGQLGRVVRVDSA